MIQIKSRFDGRVLYECEADTLLEALQRAVRAGAYLAGANLVGANLAHADLARANLAHADLVHADLAHANLAGAKINWTSHSLIAEILRREAGNNVEQRCLAGGIAISTDWCWDKIMSIEYPQKAWAIGVLLPWIQEGDNAPERLRKLAAERTDHADH